MPDPEQLNDFLEALEAAASPARDPALRHRPEPEAFSAALLATQPGAEPLATPEQAADAEYRYRVQLLAAAAGRHPLATPLRAAPGIVV